MTDKNMITEYCKTTSPTYSSPTDNNAAHHIDQAYLVNNSSWHTPLSQQVTTNPQHHPQAYFSPDTDGYYATPQDARYCSSAGAVYHDSSMKSVPIKKRKLQAGVLPSDDNISVQHEPKCCCCHCLHNRTKPTALTTTAVASEHSGNLFRCDESGSASGLKSKQIRVESKFLGAVPSKHIRMESNNIISGISKGSSSNMNTAVVAPVRNKTTTKFQPVSTARDKDIARLSMDYEALQRLHSRLNQVEEVKKHEHDEIAKQQNQAKTLLKDIMSRYATLKDRNPGVETHSTHYSHNTMISTGYRGDTQNLSSQPVSGSHHLNQDNESMAANYHHHHSHQSNEYITLQPMSGTDIKKWTNSPQEITDDDKHHHHTQYISQRDIYNTGINPPLMMNYKQPDLQYVNYSSDHADTGGCTNPQESISHGVQCLSGFQEGQVRTGFSVNRKGQHYEYSSSQLSHDYEEPINMVKDIEKQRSGTTGMNNKHGPYANPESAGSCEIIGMESFIGNKTILSPGKHKMTSKPVHTVAANQSDDNLNSRTFNSKYLEQQYLQNVHKGTSDRYDQDKIENVPSNQCYNAGIISVQTTNDNSRQCKSYSESCINALDLTEKQPQGHRRTNVQVPNSELPFKNTRNVNQICMKEKKQDSNADQVDIISRNEERTVTVEREQLIKINTTCRDIHLIAALNSTEVKYTDENTPLQSHKPNDGNIQKLNNDTIDKPYDDNIDKPNNDTIGKPNDYTLGHTSHPKSSDCKVLENEVLTREVAPIKPFVENATMQSFRARLNRYRATQAQAVAYNTRVFSGQFSPIYRDEKFRTDNS